MIRKNDDGKIIIFNLMWGNNCFNFVKNIKLKLWTEDGENVRVNAAEQKLVQVQIIEGLDALFVLVVLLFSQM